MTAQVLQTILMARNDDTESLVQILFVIIVFSISIISNILKNRSTKTSQRSPQSGKNQGRSASSNEPATTTTPQSVRQNLPPAPVPPKPQPLKRSGPRLREVSLRPRSLDLSRKGKTKRYPAGGFGEVLSGKSRLDRFLEAKLESPKRPPARHWERPQAESTPTADVEGLELNSLDDTPVATTSQAEEIHTAVSLDFNPDNIADAIVYAEILGKPLALRDFS